MDFLKVSRSEYDRLIEAGPLIDDNIINQFNKKFKKYTVSKPSICNGLDKCNIYKTDYSIDSEPDDFNDGIEDLLSDEEIIPIQPLTIKVQEIPNVESTVSAATDVEDTVDATDVDVLIPDTNDKDTQTPNTEPVSDPDSEAAMFLSLINDNDGTDEK
jgi:hypothetical protein